MTAPYPRVTNGHGSTQGIYDVTLDAEHSVGTRGVLDDGRVYYYARNSGVAIVAGNLLQSETVSGDMDDLVTGTHAVGDTTILVTPTGTATYAANELTGGYILCNSGTTGTGIAYKIKENAATTATTEFGVVLVDSVVVAISSNATTTVMKNPWMDTVISATGQAQFSVGCANIEVTAGNGSDGPYYFWCQTWGVAAVLDGDSTTIGEAIMSDTTTAGETLVATAGLQVIGTQLFTGVNADWSPVFLTIAP